MLNGSKANAISIAFLKSHGLKKFKMNVYLTAFYCQLTCQKYPIVSSSFFFLNMLRLVLLVLQVTSVLGVNV